MRRLNLPGTHHREQGRPRGENQVVTRSRGHQSVPGFPRTQNPLPRGTAWLHLGQAWGWRGQPWEALC